MDKETPAFLSFEPLLKHLRACGGYQLDNLAPKWKKILHKAYTQFVLFFIILYTVQQIVKVYQVRNDTNKVMATMFLLLTNTDSLYKLIVCRRRAHQIEELLQVTKDPIFNQRNPGHRLIHFKNIKEAKLSLYFFNISSFCTCFLWSLYPVIMYTQGTLVEFAIWLPFDASKNTSRFTWAILYVWIQTSWLAIVNTTMDVFICYFWAQSKTQLSTLRYNLENLVQDCIVECRKTTKCYNEVLDEKFKFIILHHKIIVKFTKKIENIFGGAVLYLFAVACWIFCTSVYRIVDLRPGSVDFISMLMYLMCILYEIFLYCHNGNGVIHESEKLVESAYNIDWLKLPVKQRRALITFMERTKRPIRPVAGILVELSNVTFVAIVRSSYSFYALLKNSE